MSLSDKVLNMEINSTSLAVIVYTEGIKYNRDEMQNLILEFKFHSVTLKKSSILKETSNQFFLVI